MLVERKERIAKGGSVTTNWAKGYRYQVLMVKRKVGGYRKKGGVCKIGCQGNV
jgi:hypothetical protein